MPTARVTVTLPADLVEDIDRLERNRSAFVLDAVRHELQRRRREQLRQSLRAPHPESREMAEVGFDAWAKGLPEEDVSGLVDPKAGTPVRWASGKGWVEGKR
jgi:Arc/MetJ-type ribon-helix-helix transcriptional regulator